MNAIWRPILLLTSLWWAGCSKPAPETRVPGAHLAVANSYLESAARDLLGPDQEIVRLAKPCFCPGHYDLETNMLTAVRSAALFVRFDAEAPLDAQINQPGKPPMKVLAVPAPPGTLTPDQYLALCRTLATNLVSAASPGSAQSAARLEALADRLRLVADRVRQQIANAGLRDAPVLAAAGQEQFCRWLGLKVVEVYGPQHGQSPETMDALASRARQAGVRCVVADYGELRGLGDELAKRLGVNPTRLASVPPLVTHKPSYEQMLTINASAFLPARRSKPAR